LGKKIIEFKYNDKDIKLQVHEKKIKVKLYEGEKGSEIILAHIFSLVRVVGSLHQELREVLKEFRDIFEEYTQLPPRF
jgi:hypothetical protein